MRNWFFFIFLIFASTAMANTQVPSAMVSNVTTLFQHCLNSSDVTAQQSFNDLDDCLGNVTLTFADSIVNTSGTVTLVNDLSSPGNSMCYGTSVLGVKGWHTCSSGGTPGGSNQQVQYNSSGSFAGNSGFIYDGTNVGIGTSSASSLLAVGTGPTGTNAFVVTPTGTTYIGPNNIASTTPAQLIFGNYQTSGTPWPQFIFNSNASYMALGDANTTGNDLRLGVVSGPNSPWGTFGSSPLNLAIDGGIGIGTNVLPPSNGLLVKGNVGIGSISPGQILDIQGTLRTTGFQLTLGSSLAGKVLTSNSVGIGTWTTASGGTNYWTLAGANITNNNMGDVNVANHMSIGVAQAAVDMLDIYDTNMNQALSVQQGNVTTYNTVLNDGNDQINVYGPTNTFGSGHQGPGQISLVDAVGNQTNIIQDTVGTNYTGFQGTIIDTTNNGTQNPYPIFLGWSNGMVGVPVYTSGLTVDDGTGNMSFPITGAGFLFSYFGVGPVSSFHSDPNNGNDGYIDIDIADGNPSALWNHLNVFTNSSNTFNTGAMCIDDFDCSYPFEVDGDANFLGTIRLNGSPIAASNLSNGTTGSGNIVLATSPTISKPTINTLTVNTTLYMVGNIGIGTSAPATPLVDVGALNVADNSISRYASTNLGAGNAIFAGEVGIGTWNPSNALEVGAKRLDVESGGNVGIGTSAPTGKLEIEGGNVGIDTAFTLSNALSVMGGNVGIGTWNSSNIFEIGARKFDVQTAGNVGIGSTAPGQLLDVQGTVRSLGFSAGSNCFYYCNGGIDVGVISRGSSCLCPSGSCVATNICSN